MLFFLNYTDNVLFITKETRMVALYSRLFLSLLSGLLISLFLSCSSSAPPIASDDDDDDPAPTPVNVFGEWQSGEVRFHKSSSDESLVCDEAVTDSSFTSYITFITL